MSAFLGPIHVKMYERILYQDRITQSILDLAAEEGWGEGPLQKANAKAPAAAKVPLDTIIDVTNIHGWLSAAVARCERRFALAVGAVLADGPERLGVLLSAMKRMGEEYALPSVTDAEMAYQAVHDILLDGMPCDFPFVNLTSGPDAVTWQVANCPHAPFWAEARCDADIYHQLRDAWLDGALESSGIRHQRTTPHSHSMKKEPQNG